MIRHPVLDQLAQSGVKMGLERVRSFLAHLGEPHLAYPVVHVAGTNGKGSTCMMLTSALVAAGYRVGTNLSPHLEQVNERIRIDAAPIDDVSMAMGIEALDRVRRDWARSIGVTEAPLTYFEFLTVLALRTFAERQVDVAIIETGMGGRLDATNVVKPVVTAITTVGLDHQDVLGETLPEIAAEKAGILKKGVPGVIGLLPAEAREVVEARARLIGADLWRPGPQLRKEWRRERWSLTTPEGTVADVDLPLRGEHMGHNAMVAVGVLHRLRRVGFLVPDDAIRMGLQTVDIAGRLEELAPGLVVDGAHNVDGAKALAAWLASRPHEGQRILLLGMGGARDPIPVARLLEPHVDEIVTTRCAHPKAADPMDLALRLQDNVDVALAAGRNIDLDLPEVFAEADEVVVAGSLYLAGAARSLVRDGALERPLPAPAEGEEQEEEVDEEIPADAATPAEASAEAESEPVDPRKKDDEDPFMGSPFNR